MPDCYRIDEVRIDSGRMPVKLLFSYGPVSEFPFSIIRVRSGPFEGIGEVLLPPNEFLHDLLTSLIGSDPRGLDSLLPHTHTYHNSILCEGVSMALYDLLAKISSLPLYVLLGGTKDTRVPLMPCLFPENAPQARQCAQEWLTEGYRYLKVKLIGDLPEDIARVESIRSVAARDVILQGDANEGYKTLPAAREALAELGAAGLDILEDPLEGGPEQYAQLCRRRSDGHAKVMVDKMARITTELAAVLRARAADVIGLHPNQPGSLSRALLHARMAQAMGIPVVVGGTGYTGIGSAAYQHLAAVVTPGGVCGELGGSFDHHMPRSLAREPLPMRDGFVFLPDRPGMGIELDTDALADFTDSAETIPVQMSNADR